MFHSLDILEQADPVPPGHRGRPWLGVRFACSGAYVRVYRNPEDRHYRATCPRCGRTVTFHVAPGGTSARFFEVRC